MSSNIEHTKADSTRTPCGRDALVASESMAACTRTAVATDVITAYCAAHAPVTPPCRFPAGTVFGDWRLTAFIGRGGNGEVYCAEHVSLETPAAVKVLTREEDRAKERFAREAELLAKMKSKAFPRFFAYGEANGALYLAMELLEPGDLPSDDHAVARFMLKVCSAVAGLHAQGYIHRDIKPGNILWRNGRTRSPDAPYPYAEPVLVDFGLVKEMASPATEHQTSIIRLQTPTVGGVGTPGYGAPEQMERGEATEASDIHALGVLANHCFNGKPPRAWRRIIERATSSIPERRYSSVATLTQAIRHRHWRRVVSTWICGGAGLLLAGFFLREPCTRLWAQWREWRAAPVLDASATINGTIVGDARWFLDDLPVKLPHHFVRSPHSKLAEMAWRLSAVVQRDGRTYSAKRADIVPRNWSGRRHVVLELREDPPDGTTINICSPDGTPFEFAWCAPHDIAQDGPGFWISSQRMSGRQFESLVKINPHLGTRYFRQFRRDGAADFPVSFSFSSINTLPDASLDGYDIRLEPPDFRQWRRGKRLFADFYSEMPEWAGVPPSQKDDEFGNGGWMRMDGSGKEEYIDNFAWRDEQKRTPACGRYMAVSRFWHETNTVLYCTARAAVQSKAPEDVARGESMMKRFFLSDDLALKVKAMEFCLERGVASLDDFGGTNAEVRLRFAAARHGGAKVLEFLAVSDPDPDVRKDAYWRMTSPPPLVSAKYIAQIRAEDDPGDIGKPLYVIRSMSDFKALGYLAEHSCLSVFKKEALNRLSILDAKRL